ncbi:5' nucleotidase, NT5C type [Paenibacillus sp.]|uniref:5' nucleotidase, NT5C type n=1 Tax=Paenibacillus sp. TaxID=58172 RepID=UPI002D304716|nr:hypothetical protein [Paenibacillus sp.]HZG88054.1 hypothetical protein [Paenibacillus sp.]
MRKPIIAVDMDDTICHLVKRAIHYNNIHFPTHPLRYEDMLEWNTDHLRHPECTEEVFFQRPGLYEELELFDEHVVEEMEKLHRDYDVIIVTAARPKTVHEKWNWLQRHMPFIPFDNFFVCKRKYLLEFDLLIDDGAHNLLPAMERGKQVLCIPHPWNLKAREQYPFPVMTSWQGAKERVDEMLQTRAAM